MPGLWVSERSSNKVLKWCVLCYKHPSQASPFMFITYWLIEGRQNWRRAWVVTRLNKLNSSTPQWSLAGIPFVPSTEGVLVHFQRQKLSFCQQLSILGSLGVISLYHVSLFVLLWTFVISVCNELILGYVGVLCSCSERKYIGNKKHENVS